MLVKLLRSENSSILEKAVWILGNIAGDSAVTRDAVLAGGALVPMINIIESSCLPTNLLEGNTEKGETTSKAETKKKKSVEGSEGQAANRGAEKGDTIDIHDGEYYMASAETAKLVSKKSSGSSAKNMRLLRVSVWCVSNLCDVHQCFHHFLPA